MATTVTSGTSKTTVKPTTFVWKGVDTRGNTTKGEYPGSSAALVRAKLRQQGITPTQVRKKGKQLFAPSKKPIKPMDVAIFTRQMATMMKAGIPLVQAFEIVGEGLDNASMKEVVFGIRDDVAAGNAFHESLRKYPRQFDDLFCNLVEAGEQSGALETMLESLATYKEKSEALKSKIKKAMNYPITVVVVAVVVTAILLIKVVPQFAETFSDFGAELPVFTMFVMKISDFVIEWWYIGLFSAGAAFFAFREAKVRSTAFSHFIQRLSLKTPVIGHVLKQSALARFSRTLATTFASGVPLVEALESVAGATGNIVYENACLAIRDDVTTGIQLTQAIRSTEVFPMMIVQMVSIGEESGALDDMLTKCADFYEAEVDNAVDGLTSMMEPIIMSVLGILVGGLMVAMYLPIFQLGSVI